MSNISILITCHNRKEKTIKCLEDLNKQLNKYEFKITVFLVDDGSTDGTKDAVNRQFPKAKIIKGDGNLFWNRGMNLAWKEATKINPDYYVWLNDDTFLVEDALNILLQSCIEKKNQSIIVGSTISKINQLITYSGRTEKGDLILPNGSLQECHHFNGNVVMIPKNIFEKIGFLDSAFHHSIGDFDYGLRARKNSILSFIAPKPLGYCEYHDILPTYFDPEVSYLLRLKALYKSSSGVNPRQHFIFDKRHKGLVIASFHFITINIRALIPKLWRNNH